MISLCLYDNHEDFLYNLPETELNVSVCENVKDVHYAEWLEMEKVYDWDVENYVSGNWIDSVNGIVLTKGGSPTKTTFNGIDVMSLSYNNYFTLNLNHATNGLNLGDVFRIDIDFVIPEIPSPQPSWLADFGSLATANHAFGIQVATNRNFGFNAKLDGNSSGSNYAIRGIYYDVGLFTRFSLGMKTYNSTMNILYAVYKGKTYYADNPIIKSKAAFNKNFSSSTLYIGRGIAGTNYQTTQTKYIKSIKIYRAKNS